MPSQLQPCLRTQSPTNTLLETKHHQWKAASAQYYENHPEGCQEGLSTSLGSTEEIKKVPQLIESCRSTKDDPRAGSPFACNSRCLLAGLSDEDLQATDLTCDVIWDPDPHVLSPENAAAESLLFTHNRQRQIPAFVNLLILASRKNPVTRARNLHGNLTRLAMTNGRGWPRIMTAELQLIDFSDDD
ncbi:hypothetical protein B0H13DRAFT_2287273 [Mycena leptocephala]|nr:hypothetical protein B0H13DRAFT_2287273 [Mycena leptocephala]